MNKLWAVFALLVLIATVLACDSPPWARCIVANATKAEMKVRFLTPTSMFSDACVYTPEDWASDAPSCTTNTRIAGTLDDGERPKWLEATIPAGGALELTRYRYPEIEEKTENSFLIDSLEIQGSAGEISWSGRKEIFNQLKKEGGGPLWYVFGSTPRYVFYYK